MSYLHRKDEGRPIRRAMDEAGASVNTVAKAAKHIDPEGRGVSPSLVGRLITQGTSGRERCKIRNAWLIADALRKPLQTLFNMPAASTAADERSRSHDAEDDGSEGRSPAGGPHSAP